MNYNLVRNCIGIISFLSLLAGSSRGPAGRDKRLKAAGLGALSGAALSIALNKRKADQILTATAIGAGIGARVGALLDAED